MKPGSGIVLYLALFFTLIVSTLVAHAVGTFSAPTVTPITATLAPSPTRTEPQAATPALEPEATATNTTSLWFLGDTMLSREVASIAKREGTDYSFRGVAGLFTGASVVANFEACFSPAKRFSIQEMMRFPVLPEFAPVMRMAGVTHVSLANNHGLDCGASDLLFTRETFMSASITPFGHPLSFSTTSVTYLTVANTRIALIALHTLFSLPSNDELKRVVEETLPRSDLQVIFVHWGEEYADSANTAQRSLATTLATYGIDLIVGHHPHVVQNIEHIGNTLVVYSLGNFIFDQYFSIPVQQGLMVRLDTSAGLSLALVPVSSEGTRAQPHVMSKGERAAFLNAVAARSDPALAAEIREGTIDLSFLATSSKKAMIVQ